VTLKMIAKGDPQNTASKSRPTSILRWLKFNAVGAGGIVVQLVTLAVLEFALKMDYLFATALAVEAAIVHNYFWHERFTWLDRRDANSWLRFAKFNLTTGVFSIIGNVLLMRAFVGTAHLNYFVANILTIATCSLANFFVSDHFVFRES
jgi:putative flippase GtrA